MKVGGLHHVVTNVLEGNIWDSEFKFQSHYYTYFWTNTLEKGMNTLIPQLRAK